MNRSGSVNQNICAYQLGLPLKVKENESRDFGAITDH